MMGERGLAFDLSLAIAFSLLISATVIRHQGVSSTVESTAFLNSFLVHLNIDFSSLLNTVIFQIIECYC